MPFCLAQKLAPFFQKSMSTIAVSSDLASALAAYRSKQDSRSYAALINLTRPNSTDRAWLVSTMRFTAPDVYGVLKITGRIFAWALALERKKRFLLCPLAPTQTKVSVVVSVLQGLTTREALEALEALECHEGRKALEALEALDAIQPARSEVAGSLDEMTAAFHDGRVRRACDSAKARLAARPAAEEDHSVEFVEFVFEAIKQLVKEHAAFTKTNSYIPKLAQQIAADVGLCDHEPTAIGARQLAQDFHRACVYDGLTNMGSAFGPRVLAPSATHTLTGVRDAFNSGSVQGVVALMVTEPEAHWFGAGNLDPRLANLLLGAVKTITGSTRVYDPHDVVAPHAEPVDSAEPTEPAEPQQTADESPEPCESSETERYNGREARKRIRGASEPPESKRIRADQGP